MNTVLNRIISNVRFYCVSAKHQNFINTLTASTTGIELSNLNEAIKDTPELINFNSPSLWQNAHDFLKSEGFNSNKFLSIVSKYPNIMYKSSDKIQESLISWRACQFGEKNVIELLEKYPQLLEVTDEADLVFKTLELKNYVLHRRNVWRLYMNSPNIIFDKLKITEEKLNYLQKVMKVDDIEITKSSVLSLTLDNIKCRHIFLERLGSYKVRSDKENAAEPSKNPSLFQIMDTSDKRFAIKVAFVTLEEYQTFQDLFARELNSKTKEKDFNDSEELDLEDDDVDKYENYLIAKKKYNKKK